MLRMARWHRTNELHRCSSAQEIATSARSEPEPWYVTLLKPYDDDSKDDQNQKDVEAGCDHGSASFEMLNKSEPSEESQISFFSLDADYKCFLEAAGVKQGEFCNLDAVSKVRMRANYTETKNKFDDVFCYSKKAVDDGSRRAGSKDVSVASTDYCSSNRDSFRESSKDVSSIMSSECGDVDELDVSPATEDLPRSHWTTTAAPAPDFATEFGITVFDLDEDSITTTGCDPTEEGRTLDNSFVSLGGNTLYKRGQQPWSI